MQPVEEPTMSADEHRAMEEAYAALAEMDAEEHANRHSVLDQIRSGVDPDRFASIQQCIADSDEEGRAYSFAIVNRPNGARQHSDYAFGEYYVDQYEDGGMSGDSFAGAIYIAVGPDKYLEYHYEM